VEAAELAREQQRASSLDEDSLGRLEEDIKDLGVLLSTASPLVRQHTATTTHHTRHLRPLDITSHYFLSMLSVLRYKTDISRVEFTADHISLFDWIAHMCLHHCRLLL
jgi:hypothetical protein